MPGTFWYLVLSGWLFLGLPSQADDADQFKLGNHYDSAIKLYDALASNAELIRGESLDDEALLARGKELRSEHKDEE